jgi:hypothetical protein
MIPEFHGEAVPDRRPWIKGGQSTWSGSIIVSQLSRAQAGELLPHYLELAQPKDGSDIHYMVLLLGVHRDLKMVLWGMRWGVWKWVCEGYAELIVLIPFVTSKRGTYWHNYVIGMVLDDQLAVSVGNSYFGYRKTYGRFTFERRTTRVATHRPLFDAVHRPARHNNLWGSLKAIFTAPILSDGLGRPIGTYWSFDIDDADVAAAEVEHRFVQPFKGIAAGAAKGAAIVVEGMRWRLNGEPVTMS